VPLIVDLEQGTLNMQYQDGYSHAPRAAAQHWWHLVISGETAFLKQDPE
jgi:hypothetical protein